MTRRPSWITSFCPISGMSTQVFFNHLWVPYRDQESKLGDMWLHTGPTSSPWTITSPWMKQPTWLRIVHSGDWCLHLALRSANAGDVRNDIYVSLIHGELRRGAGGKVADKNIEVTIMVCNQDGEVIPVSNSTQFSLSSVQTLRFSVTKLSDILGVWVR